MKILQVNKYYYPKGGADKYFLNISKALEKQGHQVAVFAMQDKDNLSSQYSQYFSKNVSFDKYSLKTAFKIIYNLEAKRKFEKLVVDFKPDIIHYHNIYHQLSPSILSVAKKHRIKSVMHLHDYKLICPNYQLFVNNKPCQKCKKYKYYNCVLNKCHKDSYLKSALVALEMYIHHPILNIYKKNIDHFISPSQFLKNKFVEFAWDENKFSVLVNPIDDNLLNKHTETEEDYLLYFGRLSKEKGIETLIEACLKTKQKLKILGTGLDYKSKYSSDLIEFLGFKEGKSLSVIINKAKAVVIPSIWWENMPLNMLEALSLSKIVIASEVGGMPEIIKDKFNGFLFKAGDSDDLARVIRNLDNYDLERIKQEAKTSVKDYTLENNLKQLMSIYSKLKEIL